MNKNLRVQFFLVAILSSVSGFIYAQSGQVAIPRVDMMPDLPQPYLMRDWKSVAEGYDAFVFDQSKIGTHLPLVGLKNAGTNYPALKPILLDTYVGTESTNQAEAINIIPAVIGASLVGVNKANQAGVNWVEKTKDFFNSKNNQNVYLNGYNSTSGNDWWYDLMPNIFFYQLSTLYNDSDYQTQFVSVADQWLAAVHAMGGKTTPWTVPNMNYRGWRLASMTGNASGVLEPEAAGAIGWILYHAYVKTGQQKYLDGAQLSLEFLSSLNSNPSYELMLPYGTLAAAKLNATIGTNYNIDKMLKWSFDRGALRGWGTIVGTWDGKDISGLIGEANDGGNDYAFMMNGYQQAAAFAPIIKYDKRYAKALSKWMLNLANASRLYYPQFLDAAKQDDFAWSNANDPASVIGYEAIKENWNGNALYGTGDAKRSGWAQTNLALYGSSHVGYLGAIIQTTDVEAILRIDLNKTDFFAANPYPNYAYYNPHADDRQVTIPLGATTYDIYDAIAEQKIGDNVTGDYKITVKANQVVVLTLLPSNANLQQVNGKLMNGAHVVDYHYGYDFTPKLRIKSLSTGSLMQEFNKVVDFYAVVDNASGAVTYNWYVNNVLSATNTTGQFQWTTPSVEGDNAIRLEVTSGAQTATSEISIAVMAHVPTAPVVSDIEQAASFFYHGDEIKLIARADQATTDQLTYAWTVSGGDFSQTDSLINWTIGQEGLYNITVKATNTDGLSSTFSKEVLVKDDTEPEVSAIAYYPLNNDVNDYSGRGFNAIVEGTQQANDANGVKDFAYRISGDADIIYVPNALSLNFVDQVTLSCWISISPTGREAFVLSHGSWEKRWKISITPNNKIRWTLKTGEATVDLDSSNPVTANTFYHLTAVYTGYAMELYVNGELDNYVAHKGSIQQADEPITFGQKGISDTQYYLNGVIDEVRIFNKAVQPWQIATLKTLWHEETVTTIEEEMNDPYRPFPNPVVDGKLRVKNSGEKIRQVEVISSDGRKSVAPFADEGNYVVIQIDASFKGVTAIQLTTNGSVKTYKVLVR